MLPPKALIQHTPRFVKGFHGRFFREIGQTGFASSSLFIKNTNTFATKNANQEQEGREAAYNALLHHTRKTT